MKQFIIQIIKRNYLLKNIYWHHRLRRDAKIVFKKFGIAGDLNAEFEKIKTAHALFGWLPDEFYLYHYESLSDIERKSFICEDEHVDVTDFLNTKTARIILSDKWNTYNAFHKFFDRKACYIANNKEDGEWETLFGLFNDFGALIIKPINSSFGKGIQIIENSSNKIYLKQKLQTQYPKGFIAEEIIKQDDRMAVLHNKSVNTLRIHTICFDKNVTIFHPYIRIGRWNNIVDNAGNGGVFTSCNPKTGEILTVVDEYGQSYTNHPDTGFPLIGFKVPCWNEAFQFAKQLALHNPDIHYAGWDLALTPKGWVLVEGNPRAQFIFQISEQKGFRQELLDILKKYGKDYKSKYYHA